LNSLLLRQLDVFLAAFGLLLLSPIMLLVAFLGLFDTGSPFFFQQRVGINRRPFTLIKFRTMKVDTKSVATHQVSSDSVTRLGGILRKSKLDEIPQLINVLKGDMSLVGPRPCLLNQHELIEQRDDKRVFSVLPGITGLAQVNKIDMSNPKVLAQWDQQMIKQFSVCAYFKYIFLTVVGSGAGDRINRDS
jgi:lipopolysaccharide/colanic/teichoic acid biosynthesis glycosyltransferase